MSVTTKRRRVAPPPPPPLPELYYIPELTKTFFQMFKDKTSRDFPKNRSNYDNNVTSAFQYYTDLQSIANLPPNVAIPIIFNRVGTRQQTIQSAKNLVKFKDNFPAFKELSQDPLSRYEKLEDKIIIPPIFPDPNVSIDISSLNVPPADDNKNKLAILLAICINAKKEVKRDIIPGQAITLDDCYIGERRKNFYTYLNEENGGIIPTQIADIILKILQDIEIKGSTYEYDFEDKIFILDASQNNIIFIGNKLPEPPKPRTTSLTNKFLNCLIVNTHNLYSSNAYYSDTNNMLTNLFNHHGVLSLLIDFDNNSGVYFIPPTISVPSLADVFNRNFPASPAPAVPPTMPNYIQINDGYAYLDRIYCMFDKLHDMKTRNKSLIYILVYDALLRLIESFKGYISYITTITAEEKTLYRNFMSHFEKNIKNKHIEKQLCLFMAYLLNNGTNNIITCSSRLVPGFLLPNDLNIAADADPNNLRNYCKTNTINIDLLHTSHTGPIGKLHKIGEKIYSMPELIDNGHNYPSETDNPIFKFTTNKKQVIIPIDVNGSTITINMFSHLYLPPPAPPAPPPAPPAVQELYYIVLYQIIINIITIGSQTYYVIHKINIKRPPHNKEIYNAIEPLIHNDTIKIAVNNAVNDLVNHLVNAVAANAAAAAAAAAIIDLIKNIIIDCIINSKSQQDEQNLLQLVNNSNDVSIDSNCNTLLAPTLINQPPHTSKTNIYTIDQIAVSIAMLIAKTNSNKIVVGSSAFFYYNQKKSCIGFEIKAGAIECKLCDFGMPVEDSVIANALLTLAAEVESMTKAYNTAAATYAATYAAAARDAAVAAHTDTSIRKLQLLFRKRLKEISITLLAEEAAKAAAATAAEANRVNALAETAAEAAEAAEATEAVAEAFAITAAAATPVTITDIAKEAGYEFADSISRIKKGLYDIVNIQNLREMISIVGHSTTPIIDFVSNNNLTSILGHIYNRVIQSGGNITRKKFNKSNRYKKFNKHKTLKYKKKNKTKKYKSISKRKNKTTKKNKAISKKKNNTTKKYKSISKKKNTKTYRVKHIHRKHFGSKGGGPIQTTYNNPVSNDKGVSMYQKASGYIQNTYNNPVSKDQYVSKNQTDSEYIKNTYNNPVSNDKEVSTDQEESDYMQYTDNDVDDNALITYLCAHAKNIKDNAEEDENLPYDDNCHFYEKALNFYYPEKYEKVFLLLNEAEEYPLINLCIKYELLRLIIYSIEKQGNRGDEKKEERDEGKY